jgi:hypothetical protein
MGAGKYVGQCRHIRAANPGWCASTRPQGGNCTLGNLELPGPMLRIAQE